MVIQYQGGEDSQKTRSKEEAFVLITGLREKVIQGEDMTLLVEEYSDGPFGPWGGYLGYVEKEKMSEHKARYLFVMHYFFRWFCF